jgi:hypothetical protein
MGAMMMVKLEGFERKLSWPITRQCSEIRLEGLRKTTDTCKCSRRLDGDSTRHDQNAGAGRTA